MKKIRVLRLIEYIYDDVEAMERDMARWKLTAPTNKTMTMKSVTLPLEVLDDN